MFTIIQTAKALTLKMSDFPTNVNLSVVEEITVLDDKIVFMYNDMDTLIQDLLNLETSGAEPRLGAFM